MRLQPEPRQIRDTAVCDMPTEAAIDLVDQCIASRGASSNALDDHPLHVGIADRAGRTRPRLVMQPIEAVLDELPSSRTYRFNATTPTEIPELTPNF